MAAGRVTSTDLLPGVVESQSDNKFKCEDELRRHDGAGSDDFFEPELFHVASPRAGSNLLERSRQLPGRLLAEALSSMRSRCFRPAASLGLPGNGVQPAVRQGRSGDTDEPGDEDNCRDRRCSYRGGRSPRWRSPDSTVQGFGNFRHRRHLVAGSTSRAYSRGRCRACLCGRASGHFAVGAPVTEAHGGGQQEIGNRERGASRVKFGGAPCESSSQGSQKYPARPRGEAEKAKIGCPQGEAKGVAAVGGGRPQAGKYREWSRRRESRKDAGTKGVSQTWTRRTNDPGRRSWHQLRPGCLKRKHPLVESGRSGVATASPEKAAERGSLRGDFGGARVACCRGAGVAPRRFGSRGAADVLHDRRSLRQLRAAARPPAGCQFPGVGRRSPRFLWQAVDERRHRSRQVGSYADGVSCTVWSAGPCWRSVSSIFCVLASATFQELRVCREKPRPAQLAAIRRIVRDARWLVGRAPEDGAAQTTAQNFTQVLKHKRVGYTGEEVSRPEPLTELEIIPQLPPAGAVGVVDPLTLATGEVREALFDPSLVLLPEAQRVGVRPARVHATDEEWNKVGVKSCFSVGVVVEIAREDAPIVDWSASARRRLRGRKAWDSDTSSHTGPQADRERDPEQQAADLDQRRH